MKWLRMFGGCALILMAYLVWRVGCAEVFSPRMLAQLKAGMTTNEVAAILGPPTSTSPGRWYYQRVLMRNVGIVDFDSGRLKTAYND